MKSLYLFLALIISQLFTNLVSADEPLRDIQTSLMKIIRSIHEIRQIPEPVIYRGVLDMEKLPESMDLNQKWERVRELLVDNKSVYKIVFPGGTQLLKRRLLFAEAGEPRKFSQLFRNMTITGRRDTVITWHQDAEDTVMFEIPVITNMTIENFSLAGFSWRPTKHDIPGDLPYIIRAGWEWNSNTARDITIRNVRTSDFSKEAVFGSCLGPDITNLHVVDCYSSNSDGAYKLVGANLVSVFQNVQVGSGKRHNTHGWYIENCVPRFFGDNHPTRPKPTDWEGNELDLDFCDTYHFNNRIFDDKKRSKNHPDFDRSTAKTIGGGPDTTLLHCLGTMSSTRDKVPQPMIILKGGFIKVHGGFRLEGLYASMVREEPLTLLIDDPSTPEDEKSDNLNFQNGRFCVELFGVTTAWPNVPAYEPIKEGCRWIIRDGSYANHELPTLPKIKYYGSVHRQ